jgi:hypothetical protein
LFGLPRNAVFPKAGEEADSALVKNKPVEQPTAEAEGEKGEKGKDQKDEKDKKKDPKRTGQISVPARM